MATGHKSKTTCSEYGRRGARLSTEVTKRSHQRVLVAEDHPGMVAAIRRLLVANGFEVVGSVDDGAQVVEQTGAVAAGHHHPRPQHAQ